MDKENREEVSLPGAEGAEPILEVLNRNITYSSEKENSKKDEDNLESDTTENQEITILKPNPKVKNDPGNESDCQKSNNNDIENILEIESHLIETIQNLSVSEESKASGVQINEIEPAKEELSKTSQIETETSPKTIIEIEPSKPKILKQIELELNLVSKQPEITSTVEHNNCENKDNNFDTNLINEEINTAKSLSEELINEIINEAQFICFERTRVKGEIGEKSVLTAPQQKFFSNNESKDIGINGLQNCTTPLEELEKKKLLDSLPQIEKDSNQLCVEAKKEYYQSLREYLNLHDENKPPIPLQTYRWEDLKRAKEKGGYPWTYLYKRPLGPGEEPEIVLLLRKSQELNFQRQNTESPKSLKKVRIHEQVLVKETENYINDLSDTEDISPVNTEDDTKSTHSESAQSDTVSVEGKKSKLSKLKGIIKRRKSKSKEIGSPSSSQTTASTVKSDSSPEIIKEKLGKSNNTDSPKKFNCCPPIMDKIKTMADKQLKKRNIKKMSLNDSDKIVLEEKQKILKLRESPKADRKEIAKFIEKRDSEDIVEIMQLEESPSQKRKTDEPTSSNIPIPDEIIEIPQTVKVQESQQSQIENKKSSPPLKALRKMKEHVYEDIEIETPDAINNKIDEILEKASVEALKKSLAAQDNIVLKDIEANKQIPLDRMGSSEEEVEKSHTGMSTLAPLSSIDSTSSEEQDKRPQLSPVAEESDVCSTDEMLSDKESDLKPPLKPESSPTPQDKKVTFSHVEDEAEPHREDVELPETVTQNAPSRWSKMS